MKLHCNDCNNDYDTVLPEDEIDAAVCPRCGSFGSSVPFDQTSSAPQEEPVTPPRVTAPVGHPREGQKQSEAPQKTGEGHSSTPPRENATTGNSEDRFSARVPRKGLLIGAAALILLIIAAGITWTVMRGPGTSGGDVDVVIERETPAPTPAKEEEKQAEQQASTPADPPEKPAQAQAPKPVKKAPKASSPAPKASTSNTPNTPWKYRVESPKPAPKPPQVSKNPLGKLLDVFQGSAPDVTPPSSDPRYTGQ